MNQPMRRASDRLLNRDDSGDSAAIALAIQSGFDRHYALFRYNAQQAKGRFEIGDWHAIRKLARERIAKQAVQARAQMRRERGGLCCVGQAAEKLLAILREEGPHTLALRG